MVARLFLFFYTKRNMSDIFKMKKLIAYLFLAVCIGIITISCGKDEETPRSIETPNFDNQGTTDNISAIVNENVTASVKYEYYTFSLDLYTYLTETGSYFSGSDNIKYGIEWTYSNRNDGNIYSYTLDTNNSFMKVTKVSSNHYSVIIPPFAWNDDDNKTALMNFYCFQYRSLKTKEKNGEILSSDEKEGLANLEKILNPYMSDVDAYRGKVYVDISGERFYVKSFQK